MPGGENRQNTEVVDTNTRDEAELPNKFPTAAKIIHTGSLHVNLPNQQVINPESPLQQHSNHQSREQNQMINGMAPAMMLLP